MIVHGSHGAAVPSASGEPDGAISGQKCAGGEDSARQGHAWDWAEAIRTGRRPGPTLITAVRSPN